MAVGEPCKEVRLRSRNKLSLLIMYGQPVGEEILAVIDRKARAVDGGFVQRLSAEYESTENKIFAEEGKVWPLPSSLAVVGE